MAFARVRSAASHGNMGGNSNNGAGRNGDLRPGSNPESSVASEATHDAVNHPSHYTFGGVEVIDAIEAWQLGFHLGNAVKYIARAGRKGSRLEDLKKARWYIEREIARGGER